MRTLRQPSRLLGVWRFVGLLAVISFVGALLYKQDSFINWIIAMGVILLFVNPLWVTWTAATLTCLVTSSEAYQLVTLTTLPDIRLVEAHVFAALYRLRISVVFMMALLPSILIRTTDTASNDYNFCARYSSRCVPPTGTVVFHWILVYGVAIMAAVGVLVLGAVLGTLLALWWRNRYAAGCTSLVLVCILTVMFWFFLNVSPFDNDPVSSLIPTIPYTILLFGLAYGLLRPAQHVARQRT